jgi:hypothetical protein
MNSKHVFPDVNVLLHFPAFRATEVLPNATQVNFSNDLDVLLAEIVRMFKKAS